MPSKKSKKIDDMSEHEVKTQGRALFTQQHLRLNGHNDDHTERIRDILEKLAEHSDLKQKIKREAVPPRGREPAQTCPGTTGSSHSSEPGVGGATSSTGVPDSLSEGVWTPVFGGGFGFGDGKGHGKGTKVDSASCAAVEGVHFRYFFVCLGGWAADGLAGDKRMTMLSSNGWRQLFPTVAWTHGQHWYCDCNTKYKSGNGVIVEIRQGELGSLESCCCSIYRDQNSAGQARSQTRTVFRFFVAEHQHPQACM
jgi:hypothetical protein